MFSIPAPTPYDLKFRLLGVPVRVNPFFWALAAILGWSGREPLEIVIWVVCVFVSIMVHEFGHALTTRSLFRHRPSVLLYYMGGLCFHDGEERGLWKRAAVLIMGPVSGFLLMILVLILGVNILGFGANFWPFSQLNLHAAPSWFSHMPGWLNRLIQSAYSDLIWINLAWGLFNLLPIYPLDGGQLATVFLTMHDRRQGEIRGHVLSMVIAGGLAILLLTYHDNVNAFFIASLAALNYRLFQAARYGPGAYSRYDSNDDWWRK